MADFRELIRLFGIAAAVLLAVGLVVSVGSSALELVALR